MKTFLYILVAILSVLVIIGLIAPKEYSVEREIVILRPRTEVFNYLKNLKNQDEWSVWSKRDPHIRKTFNGEDGTVGFVSAWEGNEEVGKGEQEITKIIPNTRIDTELRFMEPFASVSPTYMTTDSISDTQTRVKWGFSGTCAFPMNIVFLLMNVKASVSQDFAEGLANLKEILEKR